VKKHWIRSGRGAYAQLPARSRAQRGTATTARRSAARFAALFACGLFALPALADEVEPETPSEAAPASEAAPEPESEPKSAPESDPQSQSERATVASTEKATISEPSWIPSVDLGFEIFDYNVKTTVDNRINAPAWAGTQKEASRQDMFRIGAELMGPEFESLPGRPRLFVQGGVQIRMFSSDEIYDVGDPGVFNEPEGQVASYDNGGNTLGKNLPTDFEGQGADVFGTFRDPSWYAAVGVAFSMPIATNLLLQVKPSLEYSLEKIDLASRLTTVNELNPHQDPDSNTPTRNFVVARSRTADTTTDHSVGAGLEVALVLFRHFRPIRVSLYSEARFMWLVSGRTTTFGDAAGVASFSVARDEFGIKGGGGVRISWVGFD